MVLQRLAVSDREQAGSTRRQRFRIRGISFANDFCLSPFFIPGMLADFPITFVSKNTADGDGITRIYISPQEETPKLVVENHLRRKTLHQ